MGWSETKTKIADWIADFTSSWSFVATYTAGFVLWCGLLVGGVATNASGFDQLLLCWWAGAQTSILLMATNRQAARDRRTIQKGIELDQKQLVDHKQSDRRIEQLMNKIKGLESILTLMEKEEHDKVRKIKDGPKGKGKSRPRGKPESNG